MKLVIDINSKKALAISVLLVFLLITSFTFAQRKGAAATTQSPSIASQFGGSFVCLISQCGWPSIIFLILPAIAVYFWKKYISLG